MRIYNKELRKALKWLSSGRPTKTIRYLEPKVPIFLEDPLYYAILGRACLEAGLIKDAETYLNRGLQADPEHLDVRLLLAVVHLKRKDPAAAVRTWLEVLEDAPGERHARRGLNTLKRISDQEAQDRFLNQFHQHRFLPSIAPKWPRYVFPVLIFGLVLLTGLYFRESFGDVFSQLTVRSEREGAAVLDMFRGNPLTVDDPDVLYPMDEDEARKTLRKALSHYNDYEDNQARLELNKLRDANLSVPLRDKVLGLLDSLAVPSLENLDKSYSYAEVVSNPRLYEDCWVIWRGKTANVRYQGDSISFDLLVGFDNEQVFEGRVGVRIPFLAVMEPLPIEILARVVPEGDSFILVARTIHFLR